MEEENKPLDLTFKLKTVELLKHSLELPKEIPGPNYLFNFQINVESKVDIEKRFVIVITNVDVMDSEQEKRFGSISVSCVYEVINFEEVIKVEGSQLNIPNPLVELLNSVSISTTRGVMFAVFRGTFLHQAVLPILDPKQIKPN